MTVVNCNKNLVVDVLLCKTVHGRLICDLCSIAGIFWQHSYKDETLPLFSCLIWSQTILAFRLVSGRPTCGRDAYFVWIKVRISELFNCNFDVSCSTKKYVMAIQASTSQCNIFRIKRQVMTCDEWGNYLNGLLQSLYVIYILICIERKQTDYIKLAMICLSLVHL